MINKINKLLLFLFIMIIGCNRVWAGSNDSNLGRNYYDGYYAVYDAPDRVRLFYAERLTMNGDTAYCIQPGIGITGYTYSSTEDWSMANLSSDVVEYIRLVAYYGYDYPNHQTMRYYFATQEMIWEKISGRAVGWIYGEDRYGPQMNIDAEKNEITNLINNHKKLPSFDDKNIEMNLGEAKNIVDENNVLSNYNLYNSDIEDVSIDGNTLIIGAQSKNIDGEIQFIKKQYTDRVNLIYYNGDSQKIIRAGMLDPVLSLLNVKVSGGVITIQKLDKDTKQNKPQGDATLDGAIYNILNENDEIIDTLIIGEKQTSKQLPVGNYKLKEEKASNGYKLDTKTYYFTIDKDHIDIKLNVYEEVIKVKYNIFKSYGYDKTVELVGEPNITFEFYLKSTGKLYKSATTNNKGELSVDLPYGVYRVSQKNTTPNYKKVDDFEITIDENTDNVINKMLFDEELRAKLRVIKIDKDTGKVVTIKGIKFKIKDLNTNEYVCQDITYPQTTTLCVYETTDDGTITTPNPLRSGNYQLEEVEEQIINGYTWNSKPLKFSINDNSVFIKNGDENILEVNFTNKQIKGKFNLIKFGEELVIEDNKITYKEIKLDDVSFNLIANEDIYSADGTLIYEKDTLIKNFKTKNGIYSSDDMYLGKYCVIEVETVLDHVLDETPHCFELKQENQYDEKVELTLTLNNYLPKGTLDFSKTDLSTSEPLPNTLIEIYIDETDELIFSDRTDEFGKIIITDLPINTRMYILEKEAPENYILNEEKMYFEILENGEIVKANMTNEKIPVPITSISDSYVLDIIGIIAIVLGIGYIIYDTKKKK